MVNRYSKKREISFWGILVIVFVLLSPLESYFIGQGGSILKFYAIACIFMFVFKILRSTKIYVYSLAQIALLCFCVIVLLSALRSPYLTRGIDVAQAIGLQVVFILTLTQIKYSEKEKSLFLLAYVIGCLILSGFVLINIDQVTQEGLRVSASTSQGVIDPNNVAAYLVSAVAVLQRFKFPNKWTERCKLLGEIVLIISALMTVSRGAALALLIFTIYYIVSQSNLKDAIRNILSLIIIVIAVFYLCDFIFGYNNPIALLIERFVNDNTGGSSRTLLWDNAIVAISKKPFLGYGMGSSPYIVGSGNLGVHNTYLTIWLETGGIGLIFLLAFYYACVRHKKYNFYDKAAFDMLIITAVTSFFFDAYNKKIFWIPMLLCMISLTSLTYNDSSE